MVEDQGISFAARQGRLRHCPADRSQRIIPFEVRIQNQTLEQISFSPEDFTLLGADQRQYQVIDPRVLAQSEQLM